MKTSSHYSVIIVVTLPEWGGCHTHGATYEEAARNAREVVERTDCGSKNLREMNCRTPHEFQFPGPSGFTYQFAANV
jgi:hypothetical protein